MTIRTKLTVTAFLPLGLFLLILAAYATSNILLREVRDRVEMASQIKRAVTDIGLVTHYLIMRDEERPRTELSELQKHLVNDIARIRPQNGEEKALAKRLQRGRESVTFLSSRLSEARTRQMRVSRADFQDFLAARLTETIREMGFDAEQLEFLARQKANSVGSRASIIVLFFSGLCSAIVIGISLAVMHRTTEALSKLQKAADIVSQGNLDYQIPVSANDELARLSRAFNSMALHLKGLYASLRGEVELRTEAEREARTQAARLEASNRELQDFAFVASHDLQEPLRKIRAFGDQLKSEYADRLDAEGADYIERMENAAGRMQSLIQALLAYSRLTTKAKPFSSTDLVVIAQGVLGDLETAIHESGGRVEIGPLPIIDADPAQMRQLFQNLIANALRFRSEENPLVKVYGRPSASNSAGGERQVLFVEDNGIGFDEKYLDRIFIPFQRLHSRSEYEGTGMGLAICRKIVQRHGGTITAKSTPGKGTTFIISLPVRQPERGERENEGEQT